MHIFEKSEEEIKKTARKNRIFGVVMAIIGILIVMVNEDLFNFIIGICLIIILGLALKIAYKNDKIKKFLSKGIKKEDYKRITSLTKNATGIFVFLILFFLSDMEMITLSGWMFFAIGIFIAYTASKRPELKIIIEENTVQIYYKGEIVNEFNLEKSIVYIRTTNKVRTLCFEEGEKIYGCVDINIGKENFKNMEKLLINYIEYV